MSLQLPSFCGTLRARIGGISVKIAGHAPSRSASLRPWVVCLGCGLSLFTVMGLGVKCGDTIKLTIEGADEETAAAAMQAFLESNL